MNNSPVVAEVTRGGIVESQHRGAIAVVGPGGKLLASAGNIGDPVFPRSAIKAFQCLPAIEAGVVEAFGMSDEEIALACASHNGEEEHVRVARSALAKAHLGEELYECGPQWPSLGCALRDLVRAGGEALPVHNNCSGKHAFMLAFAQQLGVDPHGYTKRDHPVQQAIEKAMGEMCEFDLANTPCGIDGCSVPTWALPLRNIAVGFQKFASGEGLDDGRAAACRRIIAAVRAHPFMVSGTKGFCTELMQAVPRAFVKVGAEGVYCAAVAHAGIGVAIKIDDGAGRGAEVAVARALANLDCWSNEEKSALEGMTSHPLTNRRGIEVGEVRAV
ncbi:MAG: asparaginase [Anderseniella sp.]|jgi:L-asparaginase II|nr:asparaginase [Anderseniella sp.]